MLCLNGSFPSQLGPKNALWGEYIALPSSLSNVLNIQTSDLGGNTILVPDYSEG